jgi:hypothetical protein
VLEPIDMHERFGPNTDGGTVSEQVTGLMQEMLDALAAQRRWPLIG